ncbi:MAG: class I SAM-dependent methyltransferase [Planctomycetota bacterium]|nr:class I SAM-dependent methyltransferase [Planctomycetota bacterium]
MSHTPVPEDYRWLISDAARPGLEQAADEARSLVALTQSLRAALGPARTHLVLELVELRRRAKAKFRHAERMFFTRRLLEQATDEQIGAYKAARFPGTQPVADLCCGIGGDLLALASRTPVSGVDRDPLALLYAEANCRACGAAAVGFCAADVNAFDLGAFAAWHLDPDRRPTGRRTTRVELHEPSVATISRLLSASGNAGLKLAPATVVPAEWAPVAELEWIESRRECRQQVAWFGSLCGAAGQHTATVLQTGSGQPCSLRGLPNTELPQAPSIARYVVEPCSAVLAAHLTGELAAQHQLAAITPGVAYLTGDAVVANPLVACFEVSEMLPFDIKRLRGLLRDRDVGQLELKQRGVALDPAETIKKLRLSGNSPATLLLLPHRSSVVAILARRIGHR